MRTSYPMMLFLSADPLIMSEHFMTVARLPIPKYGKNHLERGRRKLKQPGCINAVAVVGCHTYLSSSNYKFLLERSSEDDMVHLSSLLAEDICYEEYCLLGYDAVVPDYMASYKQTSIRLLSTTQPSVQSSYPLTGLPQLSSR